MKSLFFNIAHCRKNCFIFEFISWC